MTVVDYELFQVPPDYQFLRLVTDDGLVGWGEPVLEGRAETVATAVEELLDAVVLGADPDRIADHWQSMYRGGFYRGGPILMSAIAGIDQALWDLKGKRYGVPVHQLLGGPVRDRIRLYGRPRGSGSPEALARGAEAAVDAGFTCLKTPIGLLDRIDAPAAVEREREKLLAIREAVGPEIDVAIDFHGRASVAMAERLVDALEVADPMFYEEPVRPGQNDRLSSVAATTSVPIATGERLFSRWDFKPVFQSGALDVAQPDLSHAGGITECHRIAAMAEPHDIALAPHCPLGPVALAACLQIDAVAHNALVQEQSLYNGGDGEVLSVLEDPSYFDFDDQGYVPVPEDPGLGPDLDADALRDHGGELTWSVPDERADDGSRAEW